MVANFREIVDNRVVKMLFLSTHFKLPITNNVGSHGVSL